jgi:hypothetical protein
VAYQKKVIKLIKMTLSDIIAKVLKANTSSRSFNISTGVRQGDALSAALFNSVLNMVQGGIVEKGNITYKSTQICAYADDIIMITRLQPSKRSNIDIGL